MVPKEEPVFMLTFLLPSAYMEATNIPRVMFMYGEKVRREVPEISLLS